MSRSVQLVLGAVAIIVVAVLAGQCAFNAGEWVGAH